VANDILTYSLEGNIATVVMDDGKANALSEAMIDGLSGAIDRAEKEANALVLCGRKDRFCAGFDLRVMMSSPDAAKALLRQGSALLMKLYGAKLPLVMACTGHALAGGALVLLTGDVRIGSRGPFKIGLNEVSIGMPVPVLAMELARDRLDVRELGPATLESRIYGPDDAQKAGYLDLVVAEEEVVARAKAEATRLLAQAKGAYSATKDRLRGKTIKYIQDTLESDMAALLMPVGK
jgi:enoyl-CoA hydratase